jgi:hypothetical protein
VAAMISIKLEYDPPGWQNLEWYFLTSAKKHSILDAGAEGTDEQFSY